MDLIIKELLKNYLIQNTPSWETITDEYVSRQYVEAMVYFGSQERMRQYLVSYITADQKCERFIERNLARFTA